MAELKPGLACTKEFTVEEHHTAKHIGSGTVQVLATPAMIAFMELTALECVQPHLEEGKTTVGTLVNVKHVAPAPVGSKVRVEAELTKVEGRKLTFKVRAYWGDTLIGEGEHERFIVDTKKFLEKVEKMISEKQKQK